MIEDREGKTRSRRRGHGLPHVTLLCLGLLLTSCGLAPDPVVPAGGAGSLTHSSAGEQVWALEVLELTNAERAAHGLAPLVLDEVASRVAYEHSWDMDLRDFFEHVNPDGHGPEERLALQGVEHRDAGENIARGQNSPQEVVKAWMESPSHRLNILYPGWTHIGIAVHSGPSRGPWWTQEFFR